MIFHVYHLRRLVLSYLVEGLLRVFAWQQGLKAVFMPFYLFILGCLGAGIAFAIAPETMSAHFGFVALSPVALTDVRAYYGTMLIGFSLALIFGTRNDRTAALGLLITAGFSFGSTVGRLAGFIDGLGVHNIHGLLTISEAGLSAWALHCHSRYRRTLSQRKPLPAVVLNPRRPEDINPLQRGVLDNPYPYYKLLRDQRPVYKPAGADFYCVSRFEDVQALVMQTEVYSSNIVAVLMSKMGNLNGASARTLPTPEKSSNHNWGLNPVDVLAIQDPPVHTHQRRLGLSMMSPRFIKGLEDEVQKLSTQYFDEFLPNGRCDFMQDMAWRLPMTMALRLVGFPENDLAAVKSGCADGVALLSSVSTPGEFAGHSAGALAFFRWTWNQYLKAKRNPQDNIAGTLAKAANDPDHPLTDAEAVSIIFQILIAGSDSSASTMGNAVKMLIEHPALEQRLRAEPQRIADFVDEVLRLESAFQGHFRVTTQDARLHDVDLPKGSRVFLMWGSANRDERFWKNPDVIDIDRENLRRHVTFGYGPHACLGRELARMEIRIVITELMRRTSKIALIGPAPYVASVFTRTLLELPIAFELDESCARPDARAA